MKLCVLSLYLTLKRLCKVFWFTNLLLKSCLSMYWAIWLSEYRDPYFFIINGYLCWENERKETWECARKLNHWFHFAMSLCLHSTKKRAWRVAWPAIFKWWPPCVLGIQSFLVNPDKGLIIILLLFLKLLLNLHSFKISMWGLFQFLSQVLFQTVFANNSEIMMRKLL
jgi:hypothetical protein